MKFHTSQFNSMRYKFCIVGYDRSLTKGTLLEEESTFTAVSRHPLEEFSSNTVHRNSHACATNYVSLVVIDNIEGYVTRGLKYLYVCVSGSIRDIFLILRIFNSVARIDVTYFAIGQ